MTATASEEPAEQTPRPRKSKPIERDISYEQYLRMPVIKQRYEIVDGEMIMSPASSPRHQIRLAALFRQLDLFVRETQLGNILFALLDVVIRTVPRLRTRQPDLAFWSARRLISCPTPRITDAVSAGFAPDLVVEVLSPEETRRRLAGKLADYAAIGVQEV